MPTSFVLLVVVLSLWHSKQVSACDCAVRAPLKIYDLQDLVEEAQVVFTGVEISSRVTDRALESTFDVTGVAKGTIGASVVLESVFVDPDDSCGQPDPSNASGRVVFADMRGDRVRYAPGCQPSIGPADFDRIVSEAQQAPPIENGSGRPAAIVTGPFGSHDLAITDADGRPLAVAQLDTTRLAAAHCPGTTTAVLWMNPRFGASKAVLFDLATMTIIDTVPGADGGDGLDRVCIDERSAVTAQTYRSSSGGPRVQSVDFTNTDVFGFEWSLSALVLHPSGNHIGFSTDPANLLLRVFDHRFDVDIETPRASLVGAEVGIAGDWTDDGTRFVALTRTIYGETADEPGGRFIQFFDGANAIALDTVTEPLLLGGRTGLAAVGVEWFDDDTVVIERVKQADPSQPGYDEYDERSFTSVFEFVSLDATVENAVEVESVGGDFVVAGDHLLRIGAPGLQRIEPDGEIELIADTTEFTGWSQYSVARLIDYPADSLPGPRDVPFFQLTPPVDPLPTTDADAHIPATSPRQPGPTKTSNPMRRIVLVSAVLVATGAVIFVRRRRAVSEPGGRP